MVRQFQSSALFQSATSVCQCRQFVQHAISLCSLTDSWLTTANYVNYVCLSLTQPISIWDRFISICLSIPQRHLSGRLCLFACTTATHLASTERWCWTGRREHISAALRDLHWLVVWRRIDFIQPPLVWSVYHVACVTSVGWRRRPIAGFVQLLHQRMSFHGPELGRMTRLWCCWPTMWNRFLVQLCRTEDNVQFSRGC